MTTRTVWVMSLVLALGCTNELTGELSREDARMMVGGAADSGRDLCEEYGWYEDGEFCDEFCARPDPDCSAPCISHDDCPVVLCSGASCPTVACGSGGHCTVSACTARLSWLQKDAYLSRAGRTSSFWPPHTTMVLTVSCGGEIIREEVAANHGTEPGAVDELGDEILVEVWSDQVEGGRGELLALADRFAGCECGNEFLSLDSLDAALVGSLVQELSTYLDANLSCPDAVGGTAAITAALVGGDLETVLADAPSCSWASGASWEDGLDDALFVLTESTSDTLADFHVCNNDALLQADLFIRFDGGDEASCDGGSSLCAGPAWFYDPSR